MSARVLYTDTLSDRSLLKNAALTLFINGEERETMRMVRVDTVSGHDRLFEYSALVSVYRSTVYPRQGPGARRASAGGLQPAGRKPPYQCRRRSTGLTQRSSSRPNRSSTTVLFGRRLIPKHGIKMAVTAGSSGVTSVSGFDSG